MGMYIYSSPARIAFGSTPSHSYSPSLPLPIFFRVWDIGDAWWSARPLFLISFRTMQVWRKSGLFCSLDLSHKIEVEGREQARRLMRAGDTECCTCVHSMRTLLLPVSHSPLLCNFPEPVKPKPFVVCPCIRRQKMVRHTRDSVQTTPDEFGLFFFQLNEQRRPLIGEG